MDFTLFKRNYYCLISGLPDLVIDGKKPGERDFSQLFKDELLEQLHADDFRLVELLYLHYDNKNLQNLLFNTEEKFFPLGKYSQEYLEEQLEEPKGIVDYMVSLIRDYKAGTLTKNDVNQIQSLFYSHVLQTNNKFLKQWFQFDKDMKNVLTAVNCRKYNYDIEKQLISVKNSDQVYQLLLKNEPQADLLEEELPYADEILQVAKSELNITEKEKAIDLIKWKFLDEVTLFNYFTIENVLAFVLKLEMVERWMQIDDETGKALFSKMVHGLKSSYEFPEEFSLSKGRA